MRGAAFTTVAFLVGAGCTLAFPLDDLQDGATGVGGGASTGTMSTSTSTQTGGAGQGGSTSTTTAQGGGPAYEDLVLADGPLLYFHMDHATTEPNLGTRGAANDGEQTAPAALVSSVLPVSADDATSYDDPTHDLDASGEDDTGHLAVPALGAFFGAAQPFTIELWARLPTEDEVESAALASGTEAGGGFVISTTERFDAAGLDQVKVAFADDMMTYDYYSLCNFDDWTDPSPRHFAFVFDPTQTHALAIYVDGLRCDDGPNGGINTPAYDFPTIDPALSFGTGWSGAVDEVALYDTALSAGAICAHAEAGGAPACN
ncbi:MAG TPA: LamG-like jellyroll fold domain-containing protein [Polyangiaceae bacterium]|nr:LamG-like jellyroll fold domain-containing protein [Polyangiaceae bacterium]